MTAHLLFDKLAYVDRLKASGVEEQQARAHADGLDQAFREEVVTKTDLATLSATLDAKFAQIDTKFAAVQTDIQKSQNRILLAIITVSFALLGAIKYLP
jgi:hypothetical protein